MIYLVCKFINRRAGQPVPVEARSELWVCGRSLPGTAGSSPPGHGCLSLVTVVCLSGRGLCVRSSPRAEES